MRTAAEAGAMACFFAGIFFLAQAYTMAFHGLYLDCFGGGCSPTPYGEPTFTSAMYGTLLAVGALGTFYAGVLALRFSRR